MKTDQFATYGAVAKLQRASGEPARLQQLAPAHKHQDRVSKALWSRLAVGLLSSRSSLSRARLLLLLLLRLLLLLLLLLARLLLLLRLRLRLRLRLGLPSFFESFFFFL